MKKGIIAIATAAMLVAGSTTAMADSTPTVYKLTEAAYPIMVNGKEYVDPTRPILSYKGSTYIPLARIADLTGVSYTWNAALKQLEIKSPMTTSELVESLTYKAPKLKAIISSHETMPIPSVPTQSPAPGWGDVQLAEDSVLKAYTDSLQNPDSYTLTKVTYPVLVNGTAYSDDKAPILSYDGSTYIPLAKIGELTGVNYKWNSSDKQVEITTK